MGIAYDYKAVDTHTLTFGQIVTNIQGNNDALTNLKDNLKHSFTGEAAEQGWNPQIDKLMGLIDEYRASLETLKVAVQKAVGTMQITDKDQGSRFLAMNI
ncbi:WXG100 family type VII secretion target [Nocardia anaemiae]|uniref:WXG100 family type VII secretion target n=1 Tax=Nocardia anaemiae TaxID=263910 RepID=UPI0007A5590B|nr:hypothetical protein [Nocardia anaemiae]